MTRKAISARPRAMGRESLGVKQVLVWLFEEQPDRIDALVGKQRRSAFIREAIEAAMAKEEKRRERTKPKGEDSEGRTKGNDNG